MQFWENKELHVVELIQYRQFDDAWVKLYSNGKEEYVFKQCKSADFKTLSYYKRESKILDLFIGSRNIVQKIDSFVSSCDSFSFCLVLESLKNFDMKKHCTSIHQILFYFHQMVCGLEEINSKNIVHMDIKPKNIMLSKNQKTIKIIDFNLSCQWIKGKVLPCRGTEDYIAPEVTNEDPVYVNRSDIWSLGSVLYEMLSSLEEDMTFDWKNEIDESKTSLSKEDVKIGNVLVGIVSKMKIKIPEKRITLKEILHTLDELSIESDESQENQSNREEYEE